MFEQGKFWYKKRFANNRNDSKINKKLYNVKLEACKLLMTKKGLDFALSIV